MKDQFGALSLAVAIFLAGSIAKAPAINRGRVKEKKGDLHGAIADFNQAISLKSHYSAAYRDRGEVKRKKGDINGDEADFNQALKLGAKP
jgi:Flp pilus assembly protein TadD